MPRGPAQVRPTPDRVKAAIFSSLGEAVPGARVLDLYAGSGALGIEALSRGAAHVTFVDRSRFCAEAIRRSLAAARLLDHATIVEADMARALGRLAGGPPFNLIFADPPYAKQAGQPSLAQALLDSSALPALVTAGAWLVIEHYKTERLTPPAAWRLDREQRHGDTRVSFFVRARVAN